MALSQKQKVWLAAYLGDAHFNATGAARLAGYKDPEVSGHENKQKPEIQEAISRHLESAAMSADEALKRIADQARGIGAYLTYEVLDSALGPRRVMSLDWEQLKADGKEHLVTGWAYDANQNLTVKFTDPQAALRDIGRHHKLFIDRTEVTGADGGPVLISEVVVNKHSRSDSTESDSPDQE